jgi:hypothetical protein
MDNAMPSSNASGPTGREGNSRLSPEAGQWPLLAAIFTGSLLLRLPFRSGSLVNWDSVNFALGTQAFDLAHHQPHPPGYIGYVLLGAALNHITQDPVTSLTMLSIVAGALASVMLYLLGSQFMPRPYAAIAAVLFALSPLVWYYSEVPLTYSVEVALALAFLWTGYRARAGASFKFLIAATLLLALLGAVRQSGGFLLLPLWAYLVWAFPWRVRYQALAVLVLANLAWLAPLLWMAGGPIAYFQESTKLTGAVVTPLSIFALSVWGLLRNFTLVSAGILVGINLALVPIVIALRRGYNPISRLSRPDRIFFALWIGPALLVYLLIHTGQLGYVLLLLPVGFLWVGAALASLAKKLPDLPLADPQRRRIRPWFRPWMRMYRLPAGLVVVGVLSNVLVFFFLPGAIYNAASAEGATLVDNLAISASGTGQQGLTQARARQYDLRRNDAHWREIVGFTHRYDPKTSAVLAVPDGAGSYRHLSYYLPDYQVYGFGQDRHGKFGHLMTAQGRKEAYTIDRLEKSAEILPIPPEVTRLIIPDAGIYENLEMHRFPSYRVTLESGATVLVIRVSPQSALYSLNRDRAVPGYFLIRSEAS